MSEAEEAEAVSQGNDTLKQIIQALRDRPNGLRRAYQKPSPEESKRIEPQAPIAPHPAAQKDRRSQTRLTKQRFGLPDGFVPRQQRFDRSILLEDNIYRMPDGKEVIPCHPKGTLGRPRHLYALLTEDQYRNNERGSIYVRTDGKIFDYSVDNIDSEREFFDTGYTMHNLERTGRYAVRPLKKERHPVEKQKRVAHASGS